MSDLPRMQFESEVAWEAWLKENHAVSAGLWLQIAKKESGVPTVSYREALLVALCYGWIDGQKGALDDQFWLQKFTPRRSKSKWSQINREHVDGLIAAGRMQPAGLREVDAAKADGRWEAAYAPQRTMTVPEDFQAALDADPVAAAFFATLNSANRYAMLYRIQDAKKPETRARRIAQFVSMLREGKRLHE
jgi:uncharacterized protein YdeI (YjbR/CyaY-like superfamily)